MRHALLHAVVAILAAAVTLAVADEAWTLDDARDHAARFNDPDAWRRDWLAGDRAAQRARGAAADWLPFTSTVFPAPDPAATGRPVAAAGIGPLDLPEPLVGTLAFVNAPAPDDDASYDDLPIRPVLVLVARGESPLESVDAQAITRSHPHLLFQTTLVGDDGEVDAVALELADGARVAIVNGRVLDLRVGNLVVVRQRADGSVEIFQHASLVESAPRAAVAAQIGKRLGDPAAQPFWR